MVSASFSWVKFGRLDKSGFFCKIFNLANSINGHPCVQLCLKVYQDPYAVVVGTVVQRHIDIGYLAQSITRTHAVVSVFRVSPYLHGCAHVRTDYYGRFSD